VKYYENWMRVMQKLRKLETYKDYISIIGKIPNADLYEADNWHKIQKFPNIKNLELIYYVGKEW